MVQEERRRSQSLGEPLPLERPVRVEPRTPDETWRLFVAIELPDQARRQVAQMAASLPHEVRSLARWVALDGVHVTLKFLGDVPVVRVPQIQATVQEAAAKSSPFSVRLGEPGVFPSPREARILWIGFQGEVRRLSQLQGRVEGAATSLGFEAETRRFTPHATVARAAHGVRGRQAGDLGFGWIRAERPREPADIPVDRIVLFRSHLSADGARYEKVVEVGLGE